jgi:hypothetical protein
MLIRILIGCALIVSIILIALFWPECLKAYKENLISEIVGVILTIGLIDIVLLRYSQRERREKDRMTLINLAKLFEPFIDEYFMYLVIMTKPPGQPALKSSIQEIKFQDLEHMYSPVGIRRDPLFVRNFEHYFVALDKLVDLLVEKIHLVSFESQNDVYLLLTKFIQENRLNNLGRAFSERFAMRSNNGVPHEQDIEMVREFTGEPKLPNHSNAIDIYILLYLQIQKNIDILNQFISIVKAAQNQRP